MPIFEFSCAGCGRKSSHLVGMTQDSTALACPYCGSTDLRKLVSRFARYRSEDERIDEMADRLEAIGEPESPSAMREMVKEMGKAMDEDSSDEIEEMFEADMESTDAS